MPRPRRDVAALLAVVAAGALVRLAYQLEIARTDPTYSFVHGNAAGFLRVARTILAGDLLAGEGVFFYGPLYPYFLAACFAPAGGEPLWLPRVVQAGLGMATAWLVYRAARHAVGEGAARWAGVMVLFYGTGIFFEGLLVSTTLDTFLAVAGLALLVPFTSPDEAVEGPRRWRLVAAGAAFGLACWGRGNLLLVAPVLLASLLPRRPSPGTRALAGPALFACGMAFAILPVAARNRIVGDDTVLLVSQGGINLFVGNNAEAQGTFNLPEGAGIVTDSDPEYYLNTKAVAEADEGRPLRPSEVSRYWTRRALHWVAENPRAFAALTWRKVRLLLDPYEIPIHQNAAYYRATTIAGRLPLVSWGALLPLAAAGLLLARPLRGARGMFAAAAAACALSVVAFFVVDRYRFTLVPLLAPFAGLAAARATAAVAALLRRDGSASSSLRALAAPAALALGLATWINGWIPGAGVSVMTPELRGRALALEHFRHGRSFEALGDPAAARSAYESAVAAASGHVPSRLALARLDADAGRPEAAETALRTIAAALPSAPDAPCRLAALYLEPPPRGLARPADALLAAETCARLSPRGDEAARLLVERARDAVSRTGGGRPSSSPDP